MFLIRHFVGLGWVFLCSMRVVICAERDLINGIGMEQGDNFELATFGGGCFWCTEAFFERLDGILSVRSGFSGGEKRNPSYEEVCSGATGHAEVIQVRYDPKRMSYTELLEVFFATHDPTTPNRQGNDIGTQYRSIIFYHTDQQKEATNAYLLALRQAKVFSAPIVTELRPFQAFYPAEEYHQNYYANNPQQPYCKMVIRPKLEKFQKNFKSKLKRL